LNCQSKHLGKEERNRHKAPELKKKCKSAFQWGKFVNGEPPDMLGMGREKSEVNHVEEEVQGDLHKIGCPGTPRHRGKIFGRGEVDQRTKRSLKGFSFQKGESTGNTNPLRL